MAMRRLEIDYSGIGQGSAPDPALLFSFSVLTGIWTLNFELKITLDILTSKLYKILRRLTIVENLLCLAVGVSPLTKEEKMRETKCQKCRALPICLAMYTSTIEKSLKHGRQLLFALFLEKYDDGLHLHLVPVLWERLAEMSKGAASAERISDYADVVNFGSRFNEFDEFCHSVADWNNQDNLRRGALLLKDTIEAMSDEENDKEVVCLSLLDKWPQIAEPLQLLVEKMPEENRQVRGRILWALKHWHAKEALTKFADEHSAELTSGDNLRRKEYADLMVAYVESLEPPRLAIQEVFSLASSVPREISDEVGRAFAKRLAERQQKQDPLEDALGWWKLITGVNCVIKKVVELVKERSAGDESAIDGELLYEIGCVLISLTEHPDEYRAFLSRLYFIDQTKSLHGQSKRMRELVTRSEQSEARLQEIVELVRSRQDELTEDDISALVREDADSAHVTVQTLAFLGKRELIIAAIDEMKQEANRRGDDLSYHIEIYIADRVVKAKDMDSAVAFAQVIGMGLKEVAEQLGISRN